MISLVLLASLCAAEPPKETHVPGVIAAISKNSITLEKAGEFRLSKDTQYLRETGRDPLEVGAEELVQGKSVKLTVVHGVVIRVFIDRFAMREGAVRQAIALKVALDGETATVTVAFNYTGKLGDPPTFAGVRLYKHELTVGKGPTRVGWEGKDGKQSVVMGGKRYAYYPALTDRQENGTLSVARLEGGKVKLTGVYHYDGVLFVIDETVKPGDPILLEAAAISVPRKTIEAVKSVVPKGWTVSASEQIITIRRDQKVGLYNPIGQPFGFDRKPPAQAYTYDISLSYRPAMERTEYERLAKINAGIAARLEALREGLRAAMIRHKFDDWLPETPEQKTLVAQYRAAQLLMPTHRLPDLYTDEHSIDVETSVRFPLVFADAKESSECDEVMKSVLGLFKAYKAEKR